MIEPITGWWRFEMRDGSIIDGPKSTYDRGGWRSADPLYRIVETGELVTGKTAPVGAMRYADWWGHKAPFVGPDGKCIELKCPSSKRPNGVWWMIDGLATNGPERGPGWSRVGTPPMVAAQPSIRIGENDFHGYLGGSDGSRPGFLIEC